MSGQERRTKRTKKRNLEKNIKKKGKRDRGRGAKKRETKESENGLKRLCLGKTEGERKRKKNQKKLTSVAVGARKILLASLIEHARTADTLNVRTILLRNQACLFSSHEAGASA